MRLDSNRRQVQLWVGVHAHVHGPAVTAPPRPPSLQRAGGEGQQGVTNGGGGGCRGGHEFVKLGTCDSLRLNTVQKSLNWSPEFVFECTRVLRVACVPFNDSFSPL